MAREIELWRMEDKVDSFHRVAMHLGVLAVKRIPIMINLTHRAPR